jgi:carbon monoxide dehydrogenase subunit G
MIVRGSRVVDAPREAVFAAICDPDTLLAVIPGCRAIEQVGDAEYRGEISLRLPGFAGTYRSTVRLIDADPPQRGVLHGEVIGALGSITGEASFNLAEDGGRTIVDYEGTAAIGGPLARLDSRFVEGLAGSLINQGLGNLSARLEREPSAATTGDGPHSKEDTAG